MATKGEARHQLLPRLGPKLHRLAALQAAKEGVSLNEFGVEAVMAKNIAHDVDALHKRMRKNRRGDAL